MPPANSTPRANAPAATGDPSPLGSECTNALTPTVPRAAPQVAASQPTTRPQAIAATGDGRTGGPVAAAATNAASTA